MRQQRARKPRVRFRAAMGGGRRKRKQKHNHRFPECRFMTVFFIGAGPGDPELITVKGQRLVRTCPVILYAGSLVPAEVLAGNVAHSVVNTAELDLDAIVTLLAEAHANGYDVAR